MWEIIVGVVFAVVAIAVPQLLSKNNLSLRLPNIKIKKNVDEEIKKIDQVLEKVASEGIKKGAESNPGSTDDASPIDELGVKNVEVQENLLEEMDTASQINTPEAVSEETEDLPGLPELGQLDDLSMEDVEEEISIVPLEETDEEDYDEDEGETKIEFDEEDDLISSLAKEVQVEEEEEIDLLRDLKGKKFAAEELESELNEILTKLKSLQGVS
ncbi:hypothetical protein [Geoglobus acetivorans]|uniref:Uncharacterized protein n=1 Tax=Geoglobus acetivorans TaxID=565033 RepID=A0A0A7GCX7_GEOAI|nr:hypothetical protein GACE_0661 [Geoglobus acetivorans]